MGGSQDDNLPLCCRGGMEPGNVDAYPNLVPIGPRGPEVAPRWLGGAACTTSPGANPLQAAPRDLVAGDPRRPEEETS